MTLLVVDTDIGTDVDDAWALLLASRLPHARLLSVSTVGGNTAIRTALARRLLDLAGRPEVPVAEGHRQPLSSDRFLRLLPEGLWLGHEGQGVLTSAEIDQASAAKPAADAAVHLLTRVISAAEQPVTVVTIGPWTNLAAALGHNPSLGAHIARHVAMGGVVTGDVTVAGVNLPDSAEFNMNADRQACWEVLQHRLPTTLVPAELTYRAALDMDEIASLRASVDPAVEALCRLTDVWADVNRRLLMGRGVPADAVSSLACYAHDPLAVLVATNPEYFEFADVDVQVAEDSGILRTREQIGGEFHVRVATAVDLAAAKRLILDSICPPASVG